MLGNIFEIASPGTGTTITPSAISYLPDQLKERNEQWYLDSIRYVISFYNTPTSNTNSLTPYPSLSNTPVLRMMKNLDYILGEQQWGNYGFLVNETANSHVFWRKNRKIATIVDKMLGAAAERVSRSIIGADPLSPDAKTERMERVNVEMFKYIMKPLLDKAKGLQVQDSAKDFHSAQEVTDWGDMDIKEHLASTYIDIAQHVFTTRKLADKSEFIFLHAIATGLACVECTVSNGQPNIVWHPSYNVIFDNRKDQRYGEEARFAGIVDNMTLTQLFERYPFLGAKEREELNAIAMNPSMINQLNTAVNNISWWTTNPTLPPNYKDAAISVVRCYWISPDEEDPSIERVYTGEIIGNKYMVNYGLANNVVSQLYTPYKPMLPIFTWTPMMIRGELNALISRITDLSDEYELYRAKIRQLVAHSKGKVHLFRGSKLGKDNDLKKMMDDFTDLNITVIEETGDPMLDKINIHEAIDMTLDPNIQGLIEINKLVEAEIEQFANQTKISLGEQTKYVGSKAFSGSLEQSALGTASLYDGLMNFLAIILRYETNVVKNLYAEGHLDWEARSVVGDDGLKLLKESNDKFCEDYLIYLTLKDNVSDSRKESVEKFFMQAVSQPDSFQFLDAFMKMMKAKTFNEIVEVAESMAKKIEETRAKESQAQQEAQARSQMSEQQHEKEQTQMVEMGKQNRQNQNITIKEQKLRIEEMKLEIMKLKEGVA